MSQTDFAERLREASREVCRTQKFLGAIPPEHVWIWNGCECYCAHCGRVVA
jgi:hypothetical protein